MTTIFDVLEKAKRNTNLGNTPAQRGRAQAGETARFEASNPDLVGTKRGTGRGGISNSVVSDPSKESKIVTPRKPASPKNPVKKPKKTKDSKEAKAAKKRTPKTIDGKPDKLKPRSADDRRTSGSSVQSAYAKQIADLQRISRRSTTSPRGAKGTRTSQEGADPRSSRARAAYKNPKIQAKQDKERKARAKRESAAAPKKDTLAARKIQNRLGVRGVKLGRGKKKAACPLIKTELNGAFNNLLDNFQSLYD